MALKLTTLSLVLVTWFCFAFFAAQLHFNRECRSLLQQRPSEGNDEESFVFNNTGDLAMNDSRLLNYIRTHYIEHPKPIPYNLKNPLDDPSKEEGQNRIVLELLKNKVRPQTILWERRSYRHCFHRHTGFTSKRVRMMASIYQLRSSWKGTLAGRDFWWNRTGQRSRS